MEGPSAQKGCNCAPTFTDFVGAASAESSQKLPLLLEPFWEVMVTNGLHNSELDSPLTDSSTESLTHQFATLAVNSSCFDNARLYQTQPLGRF